MFSPYGQGWEQMGQSYASSGSGARSEVVELPWSVESSMAGWPYNPEPPGGPTLAHPEDDEYVLACQNHESTFGARDMIPGQPYSQKTAPSWDGRGSWFAYEELVQDWLDITTIDVDQRGPLLRASMTRPSTEPSAIVRRSTADC